MKQIIESGMGTDKYTASCLECGCRFHYDRGDVHRNYVRGGEYVACPHCGYPCRHAWMAQHVRTALAETEKEKP